MKPTLRNLYQFFRDMGHVLLHRELDSPDLIILDEEEVVFVSVAKSACSSIKASITENPPDSTTVHDHISHLSNRRIPVSKRSYFVFTFVRDPYERLASCYRSKFNMQDESKFIYTHYFFGYLRNDDTFDDFVRKISKIPDFLSNRHFKSQHSIIFSHGVNVDFLGKVENLPSDFEDIRQRYGFSELTTRNKSQGKSADKLFTTETREMIYTRYKEDFDVFGYDEWIPHTEGN